MRQKKTLIYKGFENQWKKRDEISDGQSKVKFNEFPRIVYWF